MQTDKKDLDELLEEYMDQEKIYRFEGDSGLESLGKIFEAMGYEEHNFKYGSFVEVFLADNPGAVEAIIDWIEEQNVPEWKEKLKEKLHGVDSDDTQDA